MEREKRLTALQLEIEKHLEQIEKLLVKSIHGADYKLTLIARNTKGDGKDMDILLTLDGDVDAICEVVRRKTWL